MTNSDIFHQNKEKYGSPALELAFHFSCEAVQGSGVHFAKLDKNAGTGRAARLKTTNKEPPGWFKHYQVKKMMKNWKSALTGQLEGNDMNRCPNLCSGKESRTGSGRLATAWHLLPEKASVAENLLPTKRNESTELVAQEGNELSKRPLSSQGFGSISCFCKSEEKAWFLETLHLNQFVAELSQGRHGK